MEVLAAIEQLGPVRLLKSSFYAYPLVSALHVAAIGCVFTCVALLDLRVLGAIRALPAGPFDRMFRRLALCAFALAAASGAALFSVRASDYAAMPVFLAKMGLIGAAALNFAAFVAIERRGGAPRVLALSSLGLWTAVLLCGRFIGFF